MAVTASTPDSAALWAAIADDIAKRKIETWQLVQNMYLTHSPGQWAHRAFFLPNIQFGNIIFNIVPPQGQKLSKEVYAVYHGRLIEMLLAHEDRRITQVAASAMPILGDIVG